MSVPEGAATEREKVSGWIFSRFRLESGVKKQPTTQLKVKTLLNRIQHFVGFVYQSIRIRGSGDSLRVEVQVVRIAGFGASAPPV